MYETLLPPVYCEAPDISAVYSAAGRSTIWMCSPRYNAYDDAFSNGRPHCYYYLHHSFRYPPGPGRLRQQHDALLL